MIKKEYENFFRELKAYWIVLCQRLKELTENTCSHRKKKSKELVIPNELNNCAN
jgi:hypothetical protein